MYQLPGGPKWTASDDFTTALEKGVAEFASAQGITTQTGWAAFIAALSTAQGTAAVRKILAVVTCGTP